MQTAKITLCLLISFGLIGCGHNESGESSPTSYVTDLGGEGLLVGAETEKGTRSSMALLGKTQEDFQDFVKANVAQDKVGINQLIDSKRIFGIPSGSIRAKKIDSGLTGSVQVRILSGGHKDESAWTYIECLQK